MPDDPAADLPSEPDPPPLDPKQEHERLDELEEKIDHLKRQVHHDLDPHEGEPTYASSGDTPEEDDQTITPPG